MELMSLLELLLFKIQTVKVVGKMMLVLLSKKYSIIHYMCKYWSYDFKRAQDYMSLLLNWNTDPLQHDQRAWGNAAPLAGMNVDWSNIYMTILQDYFNCCVS